MSRHSYDLVVYVARLQPVWAAHIRQIRTALALAPQCLLVIAGAWTARSPRYPLSCDERLRLVWDALDETERARVHWVAARQGYDAPRWSDAIRTQARRVAPQASRHAVLYEANECANVLPWATHIESGETRIAAGLTDVFDSPDPRAVLNDLAPLLEPTTHAWLESWLTTPTFQGLVREHHALVGMRAEWAQSPYPPVFVTVDLVVTCRGNVLLIRRGREPGKGLCALPGGFIEVEETLLDSALRELAEETSLNLPHAVLQNHLKGTAVFDAPQRSQRGRVITHAYHFDLGSLPLPKIAAGDDAAAAFWVPLHQLAIQEASFHDDHFLILDHFLQMAGPDALPLDFPV